MEEELRLLISRDFRKTAASSRRALALGCSHSSSYFPLSPALFLVFRRRARSLVHVPPLLRTGTRG